jgi:hypothetical protein
MANAVAMKSMCCLGYDGLDPGQSGSYWSDGERLFYHVAGDAIAVDPAEEVRWLTIAACHDEALPDERPRLERLARRIEQLTQHSALAPQHSFDLSGGAQTGTC